MNENTTTEPGSNDEPEVGGWPVMDDGAFEEVFLSWAPAEGWSNTVTVRHTSVYDPQLQQDTEEDPGWADVVDRHLVEIDTNYKSTRPGGHPVALTRPDAARFASAVLRAIEDTFHYGRTGRLRPAEAAELLRALELVDSELAEVRSHALQDLITGTDMGNDHGAEDHTGGER